MEIGSITSVPFVSAIQNSPRAQENIKKIAVPAILTSGAVFVATKAPKLAEGAARTAENTLKMSTRAKRAGVAGLITAGVMAILSLNKQDVIQGVNKVKEIFKRTDGEKALETETGIKDKEKPVQPQETVQPQEDTNPSNNPFAQIQTANQTQEDLDNAINEADQTADNIEAQNTQIQNEQAPAPQALDVQTQNVQTQNVQTQNVQTQNAQTTDAKTQNIAASNPVQAESITPFTSANIQAPGMSVSANPFA